METNNNSQKWFKTYRASVISVFVMVLLLIAAVICHLFEWKDAPFQFLAACLGAGVTVIITNLLLTEQTRQQEMLQSRQNEAQKELQDIAKTQELEQIMETKRYEEKLRIYQDFLKCLYEVIKDGNVTKEEAIQLQFQTSYITMHTESEHIKVIAQQVESIVGNLKEDNNADLMRCLFSIVGEFRKELYLSKQTKDNDRNNKSDDSNNIEDAIKSFSSITNAVEVKRRDNIETVSNNEQANIANNLKDFLKVLQANIEPHLTQWIFESACSDNGININIGLKGYEEDVRVFLSYDDNGEHYFQVHLEHDNTQEVYEHMKWKFGGRRNKWCWWKYLDVNWRPLASTPEIMTCDWNVLLNYLTEKITGLTSYVETFIKVRQEIYYQIPKDKAVKIWMYYNDVVAIDYPDNLFFDVILQDKGYTIQMGNRNDDVAAILNTLKQLGFDVAEQDLKSKRYEIPEKELSTDDAINKIKEYNS